MLLAVLIGITSPAPVPGAAPPAYSVFPSGAMASAIASLTGIRLTMLFVAVRMTVTMLW